MCHLLLDPSPAIKKMSYSLLHQAAKPRTEYLIIEAGVDSSSETKLELPSELLSVVEHVFDQNHIQDGEVYFSQLMLAFINFLTLL